MDRVTELEIKVAWLENLVAELDGVVRQFVGKVERQEQELKELRDAVGPGPELDVPGER